MGNQYSLSAPEKSKIVERKKTLYLNAAVCSTNGFRKAMEDKHCMINNSNENNIYGIFDGHINDKCSTFISEFLPNELSKLSNNPTTKEIENVYINVDNHYNNNNVFNNGGTAAVLISIRIKEIENNHNSMTGTICNLGDSRLMIIRNNKIIFITKDHKPNDEFESVRIISAGGYLENDRIDGRISLSRAFGNSCYKTNHLVNNNSGTDMDKDHYNLKMICIPDITTIELFENDIIFLGCDGVFEGKFSNEEVCDFICDRINGKIRNKNFSEYPIDIGCITAEVCDEAIKKGSHDNISCMIIKITSKNCEDLKFEPKTFIPGPPPSKNNQSSINAFEKMVELGNINTGQALMYRYKLFKNKDNLLPPNFTELESHTFDLYNEFEFNYETTFFANDLLEENINNEDFFKNILLNDDSSSRPLSPESFDCDNNNDFNKE